MTEWRDPQRIDQTEFDGDGNCYSACLAMLLNVSLSEVPNFNKVSADKGARRVARLEWLKDMGWLPWGVWSPEVVASAAGKTVNEHQHWGRVEHPSHFPWPPSRGFYIASGLSPRNNRHSTVYKDGSLWHDPHPDRTGLTVMDHVEFLRPLYPAGLQRIV